MISLKVKICGLTRDEDARAAAAAGADYVGTVLVPGTPRAVRPERAAELREACGLPLVLVVADEDPSALARAAEVAGASVLQLHGQETPQQVRDLRGAGDWEIWKVVRMGGEGNLVDAVEAFGDLVDGIVLDTWHPDLLGGSGVTFDWGTAESVRRALPPRVSLIAAGGLRPENLEEAVGALSPDVVDVSSGVEASPGIKDPSKIRAFVREARRIAEKADPPR